MSDEPRPRTSTPTRRARRATPRDQWDILQWGSMPYDEAQQGLRLQGVRRARPATLRAARWPTSRRDRAVSVRVTIASTFCDRPDAHARRRDSRPHRRPTSASCIAAHVQEPGANDNASGVATLAELARALRVGHPRRRDPAARTDAHVPLARTRSAAAGDGCRIMPTEAKQRALHVLDGHDRRGRQEDRRQLPDRALARSGRGVGAAVGSAHRVGPRQRARRISSRAICINDLHLRVVRSASRARTGWVVKTNPYEGGSDHTVFGRAGVPSVLDWHFTDRYYHTNLDTPDKTSPDEMRNVGVSVGASAWLLASAGEATIARAWRNLVSRRGAGADRDRRAGGRRSWRRPTPIPPPRRRAKPRSFRRGASGTAKPSAARRGSSSARRPGRLPAGSRRWPCHSAK